MGQGYLMDSNAVIDFLNKSLPENGRRFLSDVMPVISIISFIEIFSGRNVSEDERNRLTLFSTASEIIYIDKIIALKAVEIRLKNKIKLPDAVIAATALVKGLTLITRNTIDFEKIKGIKIINPYSL
jgi:predicted nucleic acid-binding protein